jgi:DNA-binding GntR family transcriptional regulator
MQRRKPKERSRPSDIKEWIETGIRQGVYKPGDRIEESELRRRFGVSRTPVRDALLQLASVNLVVFRPRQGAQVAEISIREIAAMWEVLGTLEGLCAALACRRMNPEELDHLGKVLEKSAGVDDVQTYAELNRSFHECLYRSSRNDYLAARILDIRNRLLAYRRYPFERRGGIERSLAGHRLVVEALLAGDDQRADLAMREHVASAVSFLDMVAEMRGPAAEIKAVDQNVSASKSGVPSRAPRPRQTRVLRGS